jgi:hypothetical protein
MVYNEYGQVVCTGEKTFTIGQGIQANENSMFDGLVGCIFEIRTNENKDTDNEGADIYCEFDPYSLTGDKKSKFEEIINDCNTEDDTHLEVDEYSLDCVIMDEDMIDTI